MSFASYIRERDAAVAEQYVDEEEYAVRRASPKNQARYADRSFLADTVKNAGAKLPDITREKNKFHASTELGRGEERVVKGQGKDSTAIRNLYGILHGKHEKPRPKVVDGKVVSTEQKPITHNGEQVPYVKSGDGKNLYARQVKGAQTGTRRIKKVVNGQEVEVEQPTHALAGYTHKELTAEALRVYQECLNQGYSETQASEFVRNAMHEEWGMGKYSARVLLNEALNSVEEESVVEEEITYRASPMNIATKWRLSKHANRPKNSDKKQSGGEELHWGEPAEFAKLAKGMTVRLG